MIALTCDTCGYRSNEVKSGAGVSEKGTWIALHFTDPSDVSRDILKVRSQEGSLYSGGRSSYSRL